MSKRTFQEQTTKKSSTLFGTGLGYISSLLGFTSTPDKISAQAQAKKAEEKPHSFSAIYEDPSTFRLDQKNGLNPDANALKGDTAGARGTFDTQIEYLNDLNKDLKRDTAGTRETFDTQVEYLNDLNKDNKSIDSELSDNKPASTIYYLNANGGDTAGARGTMENLDELDKDNKSIDKSLSGEAHE